MAPHLVQPPPRSERDPNLRVRPPGRTTGRALAAPIRSAVLGRICLDGRHKYDALMPNLAHYWRPDDVAPLGQSVLAKDCRPNRGDPITKSQYVLPGKSR